MYGKLKSGMTALVLAGLPMVAAAEPLIEASYDTDIPMLVDVVGHASGVEITTPDEAITYMRALEAAAPDQMKVVEYAQTWEGRPLIYAIISSPENMARIDEIKADIANLASGRGLSDSERKDIVARTPAVTWLSYGVHGDEISSTDAALALAHHLLASEDDEIVADILAKTIVIIDPMQNPDGRSRFVNSFEAARGLETSSDRFAAEHDQPWPGGRFNHYLFDMNRDWFAMTQPETQGRVKAMLEWNPVVVVDAHEMGGDETYFFAPAAEPFNPNITDDQRQKQVLIGKNHARWFDLKGFQYFTREVYDAFYPGYGDMWPTLNGAIAMTYEQGSARGLIFERSDGTDLTYRDGVSHHFYATLSTAQVVAANKDKFLGDYANYRASAVSEGRGADNRFFVIDLSTRRWQGEDLARRLVAQGVAVSRVEGTLNACGQRMEDGALVVDRAQPNGRLINTLLSRDTELPTDFMTKQEDRRSRGLHHELYDVTAWSLPLMDGLDVVSCKSVTLDGASPVSADAPIRAIVPATAAFGYAIPWTDAGQASLALAAMREGLVGKATNAPFTVDGRTFPRGTIVLTNASNGDDLGATLTTLATGIGAEFVGLSSSWVDDGPNVGSGEFTALKSPRVAMAWGEGTNPTETGATRYIIERQLGVPVAPIRVNALGRADLDRYDVLILPDGYGFTGELGGGADAIKAFVERGGVLIGFGSAVGDLAGEEFGLLSTSNETAYVDPDAETSEKGEAAGPVPGTRIESLEAYEAMTKNPDSQPEDVPGVLVNLVADTDHWLSAGYDNAIGLFTGSTIYSPLNAGEGTNVFRYAGPGDLLASGYLWDESRLQLAYKPFVMSQTYGDGVVIGFTQSPVTRGYLNGLTLMLANALLLGPAHTG